MTPAALLTAALLAGCSASAEDLAAGAGPSGQPTVGVSSDEQPEPSELSEAPASAAPHPAPSSADPTAVRQPTAGPVSTTGAQPTTEPVPSVAPEPATEPTTEPTTAPAPEPTVEPAPAEPTAEPTPEPTVEPAPEPADDVLRPGDTGEAVLAAQQRLTDLGYWLGPADGDYGDLTRQAVLALQKAAGIGRDGLLGPDTTAALDQGVRPQARHGGDSVEIDLDRQLLLVVRGGAVQTVLNTSTGTFEEYVHDGRTYLADTPRGTWQVSWAVDGVRDGNLGRLYRPRYFHRDGIAVHGYPSVPAYPASHGCARVSNAAMDMIWAENLMPRGSTVHVY